MVNTVNTYGCQAIKFTYPYYSYCELVAISIFSNGGWSQVYDYCGYKSGVPSMVPSLYPSLNPTSSVSIVNPSVKPSSIPIPYPTIRPTSKPSTTLNPSVKPSFNPTAVPSAITSSAPTCTNQITSLNITSIFILNIFIFIFISLLEDSCKYFYCTSSACCLKTILYNMYYIRFM